MVRSKSVDIAATVSAATIPSEGDSISKDNKFFGAGGKLQEHPTEQHMITYTLSDDQLDFIEAGGSRFTLLSSITAFMLSATLSCFLSGLTVTGKWEVAQYASFRIASLFAFFFAIVFGIWACIEYRASDTRKERIKRRSFEPGTLKTLKDLREDGNV
jgi:hypothetical protein